MIRRLTLPFVLVVAGFVAGLVVTGRMRTAADSRAAEPSAGQHRARRRATRRAAAGPARRASPSAAAAPTSRASPARRSRASRTSRRCRSSARRNSPFANDPFFRYFFGDDEQFGSRDRRSLSLGSGVIISADGYVITNSHVVGENVREITIALPDKREIKGKVIGTDPATDIALLKIRSPACRSCRGATRAQLKVGEWVLAIGSPFQLSQTVTAGIVSATGRANMGFADYEDFIQTDAAINPGNSGGALINSRGELVGINTGIYSESGGYQGIGFAVPSNARAADRRRPDEVRRSAARIDRLHRHREADAAAGRGVRRRRTRTARWCRA